MKQATANCGEIVSPILPPDEYKRGVDDVATAIPPFAKLLWSLFD